MKKIALVLILALVATTASAQMSKEDVETARAKLQNVEQASAVTDAVSADIDAINVRIIKKSGDSTNANTDAVVGILPTDEEFASVLAAVQAVAARRAAQENTALEALGVTVTAPTK